MDRQYFPSASLSKFITNYSKTLKRRCIAWVDAFTVGNQMVMMYQPLMDSFILDSSSFNLRFYWSWKIGISQEGILKHHLYIHLSVANDEEELAKWWYRETYFRLTLCQLITPYMTSRILEKRMVFTHEKRTCRWPYGTSSELRNGYVVNDTIKVNISMIILRAFPIAKEDNVRVDKFQQSVSRLARYLEGVERGSTMAKAHDLGPKEKARQSLKECLLSPYDGPNVLDKLREALTTLNVDDILIQIVIRSLKDYMGDYWMVQKTNFECEMWLLNKAWLFSLLKKSHVENIEFKGELDGLIREGLRLKERIKQVSKSKEDVEGLTLELERVEDSKIKVSLKLEIHVASTDNIWSSYRRTLQRAAQAEKKKGAAEEILSVSSKTWSSHMKSLLNQFP